MPQLSPTVIWAVLGILLGIAEVFSGAFVLLFFGLSALLVAIGRLLGLDGLAYELILFAAFGMGMTLFLRRRLVDSVKSGGDFKADRGTKLTLSADIPAKGTATIEYQGAPWTAVNEEPVDLRQGQRAVIVRTEGVKLHVRGE